MLFLVLVCREAALPAAVAAAHLCCEAMYKCAIRFLDFLHLICPLQLGY
jgi:hypothetical protein